ncbi:DUF418 domain-containing protein [Brevibacillus dissolubilis]|uniref:DUF418 domain-containing protein n=1 Tax=Brevibacillus dissolubilis TaxID=1844116 RepID=UPI00159BC9FE|nr:DUF418 domain-containing protein [Brevibacillus dissolubilis]
MTSNHQPTPTTRQERIATIDIIRGFALLGILIMNMGNFSSPYSYMSTGDIYDWPHASDRAIEWIAAIFFGGKFYTIFSFLFGLGTIIFMQRAEQKGYNPVTLLVRRLLILLGFGLIHAVLVWSGDILLTYAITGFFFIWFWNKPAETVLRWAWGLLLIPTGLLFVLSVMGMLATGVDPEANAGFAREWELQIEQQIAVYGEGTYVEMIQQRLVELGEQYSAFVLVLPQILAMFLFGVYAAKIQVFQNIEPHVPWLKKLWRNTLLAGLVLSILHIIGIAGFDPEVPSIYHVLIMFHMLSGPIVCLFYLASIALLLQRENWQKRFRWLAPVGRMSITNYLMQSLIGTTIFYNYGLGLYNEMTPLVVFGLSLLIYLNQVLLSNFWLSRHRFGPIEWLWRRWTYGKTP